MPPVSRMQAKFLAGGLGHGMPADTALSYFDQFQAQRDQKKAMLSELIGQTGNSIMSGMDPTTAQRLTMAQGQALGFKGPRLTNMLDRVTTGIAPGQPSAQDIEAFDARVAPYLQQLAGRTAYANTGPGDLLNRAAIREQMKQHFGIPAEDEAVFNTLLDQWYEQQMAGDDATWDQYQKNLGNKVAGGGGGGASIPGHLASTAIGAGAGAFAGPPGALVGGTIGLLSSLLR